MLQFYIYCIATLDWPGAVAGLCPVSYFFVDNDGSLVAGLGGQRPAARLRGQLLHGDQGGRGREVHLAGENIY